MPRGNSKQFSEKKTILKTEPMISNDNKPQ